MRGREFLMKDAYSFDLDYAGAVVSYRRMMLAYMRTFQRLGVKAIPMVADTGPIGGDLSHEFIILAPTGRAACSSTPRSRRSTGWAPASTRPSRRTWRGSTG